MMTKTNIFVLSYSRAKQFFNEVEYNSRYNYFIINNNVNQDVIPTFSSAIYTTEKNIGCAGGWNLICDIAFNYLGLEKIIITQDDCKLSYSLIDDAISECTPKNIVGIIQPHFEFSCFAIHNKTYKTIGKFDENFINVYCEDADYKQRCMLQGITISSIFADNREMNQSASIKDNPNLDKADYNREYLKFKWGNSIHPSPNARADNQPPFQYKTPFASEGVDFPINYIPNTTRIKKIFGDSEEFPSELEYKRFQNNGFIRPNSDRAY
jgi:hypothetical protein